MTQIMGNNAYKQYCPSTTHSRILDGRVIDAREEVLLGLVRIAKMSLQVTISECWGVIVGPRSILTIADCVKHSG